MRICLLFTFLSPFLFATPETQSFNVTNMRELKLNTAAGKVAILKGDDGKVTVVSEKKSFPAHCHITTKQNSKKFLVSVESEERSNVRRSECEVDFEITIPRNSNLDLKVGTGNVTLTGIEGELEFNVGSGNLAGDGKFVEVDGKIGAGNIVLKGIVGKGEVKAGAGDMELHFAQALNRGEWKLKAGSGNAVLYFPKGTKLKTSFKSGSGKLQNELGEDPNAQFTVAMKSGSGNLTIK